MIINHILPIAFNLKISSSSLVGLYSGNFLGNLVLVPSLAVTVVSIFNTSSPLTNFMVNLSSTRHGYMSIVYDLAATPALPRSALVPVYSIPYILLQWQPPCETSYEVRGISRFIK
ncbi:hypothetical protein Tco_0720162 [Tanacetum coccineum]